MCRHLAYLGPAVPLEELIFKAPHGLNRQAWAPRDMRGGGTINADGFGVGWWPDGAGEPVRYRRATPIWSDPALPALAAVTHTTAVLAAVRSATVGMPVTETAAAPFAGGGWLFSHNGRIPGWPDSVVGLAQTLPTRDLLTLDAATDSALLWAVLRHRIRRGDDPATAVAETVTHVRRAAPGARLNLLLTDGRLIIATAAGHALAVTHTPHTITVASEPLDDGGGWAEVPQDHLLVATRTTLTLTPLEAS